MNQKGMHRQRQYLIIAAGLGAISIFLPWVKMDVGGFLESMGINNSLNGFRGLGILVFLTFVVTGILAFTGAQEAPLDKMRWLIVIAGNLVSIIATGAFFLSAEDKMRAGMGLVEVSIGAGALLALAAAIFAVASAWLLKPKGYTIRDSWQTIVKDKLPAMSGGSGNKRVETDELEKLIAMRNEGKISEEAFEQLKAELFSK